MHKNIMIVLLLVILLPILYTFSLRWINPPITMIQIGSLIKGYGIERKDVKLKDISPYATKAVIMAEDHTFYVNNGFDLDRIAMTWIRSRKTGRPFDGTSTLSQLTAKNIFLWGGHNHLLKKAVEAYFTVMLEKILTKDRILEIYMNISETGEGLFGVEAASEYYFEKSAKRLSPSEASYIVSVMPNPIIYTLIPLSNRAKKAQPVILYDVLKLDVQH